MKKHMLVLVAAMALSGCANDTVALEMAMGTTPGTHLPGGLSICNARDEIGRCKDWSVKSDRCINPKGPNEPNPVVPCSSIKK